MNIRYLAVVSLCLALSIMGVQSVVAQTGTGNINGTVTDPNGDPLPGVTVTVTAGSTMGTLASVTSASGKYRFPALLPDDDYIVTFAVNGFRTVVRERIWVQVGVTTPLNLTMELAEMGSEITVTGESPMIDTETVTSSTNFGGDLLDNIPNTRSWGDAILAAPGMVSESGVGTTSSARGGSVVNNDISYDGVRNTNPIYNAHPGGMVYEAVQEVQILTGGLPAEMGNLGGAYINVVTKSGGNEFHGEVAAYFQNENWQSDNVNDDLREQGVTEAPANTNYDDYAFNLGGPILRDKVWFNAGYWMNDLANVVNGFPYDYERNSSYYTGKITWQPAQAHRIILVGNYSESDIPYSNGNILTSPEATWNSDSDNSILRASYMAVLGDSSFFDFDIGTSQTGFSHLPQDDATTAYIDLVTGLQWGAQPSYQAHETVRNLINASYSLYKDDWGGDHTFKFGLNYENDNWKTDWFSSSPVYTHYMQAGAPLVVLFSNFPINPEMEMEGFNLYAQDSWVISPRVTLNLGLRYNNWTGSYPAQGNEGFSYGMVNIPPAEQESVDAIKWSTFDPRLGASIQLDDAGKSVLRLGLNRYHHSLNFAFFTYGNANSPSLSQQYWIDLDGNLFADPTDYYVSLGTGGTSARVDPDLKQPYTDEIFIGFEQELFTDFTLGVNLSWRKDGDLIETNNEAISADSFLPVEVPDPGADNVFGTGDDQILTVFWQIADLDAQNLVTNPERAEREYRGVEIVATKRMSNNWQMLASLVWTDNPGTVGNQLFGNYGNIQGSTGWANFSGGFNNPNNQINIDGPLGLAREWQFKVVGTYLLPWGFAASGTYSYLTGFPLYRGYSVRFLDQTNASVTADPRDRHLSEDFSKLDLRLEKVFSFGAQPWEIGLILDVFNVFNENNATSQATGTGTWDFPTDSYIPGPYSFGTTTGIQTPRIMRLGARLRF